jgi:hypothetical protein
MKSSKPIYKVEILDYTSRILISEYVDGSRRYQIETKQLSPGFYIIRAMFEDMDSEIIKIVNKR